MRKGVIPGALLILIGVLILLDQFVSMPSGVAAVAVGLFLLLLRAGRGARGFTIAGSILLCAGVGFTLTQLHLLPPGSEYPVNILFLAVAFFLMHIIEFRRMGNWPIIPGICLVVVAGIVFVSDNLERFGSFWGMLLRFWPLALICGGAALLLGTRRKPPQSQDEQEDTL